MAAKFRASSHLQRELLRLLRPHDRRLEQQLSERVHPSLHEVARRLAGHPPAEVQDELAIVIRAAGGKPNMSALADFAEQIAAGANPFD